MWQSLEVAEDWSCLNNAAPEDASTSDNGSLIDGGSLQAWSCHARVTSNGKRFAPAKRLEDRQQEQRLCY